MTVSIITATYNAAATIADCLKSVHSQTLPVEHIIIDGASTDNTLDIVQSSRFKVQGFSDLNLQAATNPESFRPASLVPVPNPRVFSEPDNGIYDAMNKGIRRATGDIIGILNADDFYAHPQVIEKVTALFRESGADALFADLVYVRPDNLDKVVRYYSGAGFTPDKFAWGWMPPHPTFFVRRELYERYGLFCTDYRIAADYELTARFLARHRVRYVYLPEVIVRMRTGGVSTRNLRSNWILNREILRACAENGIPTNMLKVYSKYFRKVTQLFARPA